eukprot:403368109
MDHNQAFNAYPNQIQLNPNAFSITDQPIVWIDLEMTGLNVQFEKILEIGIVITDSKLTKKVLGPNIIVQCDEYTLQHMDDWNQTHHKESGLLAQVRQSNVSLEQAEQIILAFLQEMQVTYQSAPLAGNCIHTDRKFMRKYMPNLVDYLNYKIIDVTTFKQLCWRWNQQVSKGRPRKAQGHRALDDILESIEEMKYYQDKFIKLGNK